VYVNCHIWTSSREWKKKKKRDFSAANLYKIYSLNHHLQTTRFLGPQTSGDQKLTSLYVSEDLNHLVIKGGFSLKIKKYIFICTS